MRIAIVNLITQTYKPRFWQGILGIKKPEIASDRDFMIVELGKSLVQRGHEVVIFVSDFFQPQYSIGDEVENLKIIYLPTRWKCLFPPPLIPFTPALIHKLRSGRFDIVFCSEFFQWGSFLAAWAKRKENFSLLVWQEMATYQRFSFGIIPWLFYKTVGKWMSQKVNAFVPRTEIAGDFLREVGVRKEKITSPTPHGVDEKIFKPLEPKHYQWIYEKLKIDHSAPVLLTVSRLHKEKGIEVLLRSFEVVLKEFPQARLIIKGGGYEEENFRKLVQEMGMSSQVCFWTEPFNHERMAELYNAADLVVQPSFSDLLFFAPLEAIACGKPVITTKGTHHRETFDQGKEGVVVKTGDVQGLARAILILLRDKGLRVKTGEEALRLSRKKFTNRAVVYKLEKLFQGYVKNVK